MIEIEVDLSGPLFTGAWSGLLDDMVEDIGYELGGHALERVQYFLDRQIQHPTPYYETQITQQRRGRYEVVHDRGIVYGPWLEGTSRRNARSSFKGYASFRKARDELVQQAPGIVDRVISRHIGRLG